ncbi:hypothetical protein [Nocardia sp. NPDC049707]|uniref:hypothetical protein n=1 Tax=Nocardia sp. NPDC049707 TaxID=3154735 RepID=UPI00343A7A37
MIGRGYLTEDSAGLRLTEAGQAEVDRIQASWRRWLGIELDDWDCSDPADRALFDRALQNIAAKLLDEETGERDPIRA